jgi:GTP cyclohydrolase IA
VPNDVDDFQNANLEVRIADGIRSLINLCGDSADREGVQDTPGRVARSFHELTWGLRIPEEEFLGSITKSFDSNYDEVIAVRNVPFVSLCEHHLLPIIGRATVAYIPRQSDRGEDGSRGKVLGLSKMPRIVQYYAARFQLQERMTKQIADAILTLTHGDGVAVTIRAEHACMSLRGPKVLGAEMITNDFRGLFREPGPRAEFLALTKGN